MPLSAISKDLVDAIVAEYPRLESLNLSQNAIRHVDYLHGLSFLQQLNLSHNQIRQLPSSFGLLLPHLTYLNLNHNQLSRLQVFAACRALQSLEIGWNRVEHVSELTHLQPLTTLQTLVLRGNPMETKHVHYRREVIAMLPQITSLDGTKVTSAEKLYAKLQKQTNQINDESLPMLLTPQVLDDHQEAQEPVATQDQAVQSIQFVQQDQAVQAVPSVQRDQEMQTVDQEPMQQLQLRLQDQAADACVLLLERRVQALESILKLQDQALEKRLGTHASFASSGSPSEIAAAYTSLLQLWRGKVLQLLVQTQTMELQQADDRRLMNHKKLTWQQQQDELDRQCALWEQRCRDAETQCEYERTRVKEAQHKCQLATKQTKQATQTLDKQRQQLGAVSDLIVAFCASDNVTMGRLEQLDDACVHLQAFETRLQLLQERLVVYADVLKHREARLRNGEAAIEAERRWLQYQTTSRAFSDKDGTGPKRFSLLRKTTEEALRALFHRLDPYETGLVRVSQLVAGVRQDPMVLRAVKGRQETREKLVLFMENALADHGVGKRSGTITWGELLLLFLPRPHSTTTSFPDQEQQEEEVEELVPPFALDDEMTKSTHSTTKKTTRKHQLKHLSREELVAEIQRLETDRMVLRQRVAQDAQLLQRRAQLIQREWEAKLKELMARNHVLTLQSDRQAAHVKQLSDQMEALERQHGQAQLELNALRRDLVTQATAFETDRTQWTQQQEEALRHEQEIWKKELEDASVGHSLLKTQHVKQELRIRQLERELASAKEKVLANESLKLTSLEHKVRKKDDELAKLRRERNSLLTSLRDCEAKLHKKPSVCDQANQTQVVESKDCGMQTDHGPPRDEKMVLEEISQPSESQVDEKLRALESLTAHLLMD